MQILLALLALTSPIKDEVSFEKAKLLKYGQALEIAKKEKKYLVAFARCHENDLSVYQKLTKANCVVCYLPKDVDENYWPHQGTVIAKYNSSINGMERVSDLLGAAHVETILAVVCSQPKVAPRESYQIPWMAVQPPLQRNFDPNCFGST